MMNITKLQVPDKFGGFWTKATVLKVLGQILKKLKVLGQLHHKAKSHWMNAPQMKVFGQIVRPNFITSLVDQCFRQLH